MVSLPEPRRWFELGANGSVLSSDYSRTTVKTTLYIIEGHTRPETTYVPSWLWRKKRRVRSSGDRLVLYLCKAIKFVIPALITVRRSQKAFLHQNSYYPDVDNGISFFKKGRARLVPLFAVKSGFCSWGNLSLLWRNFYGNTIWGVQMECNVTIKACSKGITTKSSLMLVFC